MAGIIGSEKARGVITEAQLRDDNLFNEITGASVVFSRGRNIGAMPKGKMSIPIPESLISASFVNGETGDKPVTDGKIGNNTLVAGKIAGIILIPQDVIDDADIDLWEQWIRPNIPDAFGAALDAAALFGAGAPTEWTGFQSGLVPQAVAKGNTVPLGNDIYQDIMGPNGLIYKVNADGFRVNGFAGDSEIEAELRGAVDGNGRPLYNSFLDPIAGELREAIAGKPYYSLENGAWFDTVNNSLLIGGDFNKLIYSIRKEIEYHISTDASVKLPNGEVVNCFQQNVVAFLMEMRVAAAVLNPVTRKNPDDATRFPFAVLTRSTGTLGNLTVTTEAGAATGGSHVDIAQPLVSGQSYVYQAGATAATVTYDEVLGDGWTALPANGNVTGLTAGQTLTVALINTADKKAKASGTATIAVK
ncbi:MAG: phage major capsid protein [Clostridia bacterium]|nr:phage major capsid protein [Clostridia bacterium]